jgi:signal peptidase I
MSLPPSAKAPPGSGLFETFKTLVYAVAIAMGIRTFAFEPFNIPSASMVPTLLIGDYLFVSKFSYGYSFATLPSYFTGQFPGRVLAREPERGDVVVFKLPKDGKTDYIKRLVGLPGDRIQVIRGVLHINGEAARLERVEDFVETEGGFSRRVAQFVETLPGGRQHRVLKLHGDGYWNNTPEFVVPAGHYFAMGDHRDNSQDSRDPNAVGFVPFENIVGRAEILFFSTDGTANLLLPWTWLTAARYSRLLDLVR